MHDGRIARRALTAVVVLLAMPDVSAAQRTFVATYGSDAYACSIAAPCRQLSAALAKTDTGGEIVVLDSGGFGPVVIAKSVTIAAAPGAYAAMTVFSGNGVTVNGAGIDVTLRGLRINGQGGASGIFFQQGSELHVDDCTISNMGDNGIDVRAPDSRTTVSRSVLRSNTNSGLYADAFNGAVNVVVTRSEIENNNWGLYVRQGANVSVSESTIAANVVGVFARVDNPTATFFTKVAIAGGAVSANLVGLSLSSTQPQGQVDAAVSRSALHDNALAAGVTATTGYALLTLSNVHANTATMQLDGAVAELSAAWSVFDRGSLTCLNGAKLVSFGNNVLNRFASSGCNVTVPPLN